MEPSSTSTQRPRGPGHRRFAGFLAIALIVVLLDQAAKATVRASLHPGEVWPADWDLIRFAHVHNTGAAFGILQGASGFLVVATLVAIVAITFFLFTLPAQSRWYSLALSAILGGAIGNLVDRLRLGHVTDFIDPTHYPAFNLADSAIVIGVFTIAILSFLAPVEDESTEDASETSEESRTSEVRT